MERLLRCLDVLPGWGRRESRACFGYEVGISKDFLWIACCYNPCRGAPTSLSERELVNVHSRDASCFVSLLKDCSRDRDLHRGARVHDDIVRTGLLEKCADALVCMYARCGALSQAGELFDQFRSKDAFTWTTLIAGCVRKGEGRNALSYFEQMQQEGIPPNAVTFACILKACGEMRACDKGEQIHDEIHKQGLLKGNIVLSTALISMYAKCGALVKAQELLNMLPAPDAVSWNVLITGYIEHGQFEQAWTCFEQMQSEHLSPSAVTFVSILKVCGSMRAADKGKRIHDEITKQGLLEDNIVLGTALVGMYTKCGDLAKARQVLEELPVRDTIAWTALIAGYSEHGQGIEALDCFEQMEHEGVSPNAVTFASVLKACGNMGEVAKGERIHHKILNQKLLAKDTVLGTALIDMYCKCGTLAKAQQVLKELGARDVVCWNVIIAGYTDHGDCLQALSCFWQMWREDLFPNAVTFASALKACSSIGALLEGEKVHDEIVKQGLLRSDAVLGTALVDMYAKCGALVKAAQVLKQLQVRDVTSWTALIAGYVEHGESAQALDSFEQMQNEGLSPNAVTLACLLKAAGSLGASVKGEKIHNEISRQGLLGNSIDLGIALVDMYAKCGALMKARQVLNELPFQNVSCWNALMAGYIQDGQCAQALVCFEEMQKEGLSPDGASFVCVLSACSRLGLIAEAQQYYSQMTTKFGLNPDIRQYTCIVDGLGRVGCLSEGVGVTEDLRLISCEASFDSGVWSALLGACQRWGDSNVGKRAFEFSLLGKNTDTAKCS